MVPSHPVATTGRLEAESRSLPTVSTVIVCHNAGDDLGHCLESVLAQRYPVEIVLVDNESRDGSVSQARATHADIKVVFDGINDGFAGGANRGAAAASGEILFFLNPDVILEPGCISALSEALSEMPSKALCGPVVVNSESHAAEYGVTIDLVGDPVGLDFAGAPLYLAGCAIATTREAFVELGGFDTAFFMFCEDLELCWRALLRGFDVRLIESARVRHRGGGSTGGGYITDGRINVTPFRIALRERNALATVLECGPVMWLALVVPLRLARIAVIALVAVASRRSNLARSLAMGVLWNVRRLPKLMRRRIHQRIPPSLRRRVLFKRMLRDVNSVRVLVRHGMPRFVDRGTTI